jgi:hypothetical protein
MLIVGIFDSTAFFLGETGLLSEHDEINNTIEPRKKRKRKGCIMIIQQLRPN